MAIYDEEYIIRPANYPEGCAGRGLCIIDMGSYKAAVVNLMGTVYMEPLDNPFTVAENILKDIGTPNIFVDFHAEATAEKKKRWAIFFPERRPPLWGRILMSRRLMKL